MGHLFLALAHDTGPADGHRYSDLADRPQPQPDGVHRHPAAVYRLCHHADLQVAQGTFEKGAQEIRRAALPGGGRPHRAEGHQVVQRLAAF